MRLDKYLAHVGLGTRKEVKEFIRKSRVTVNGKATTVKLYEYKTIEEEGIIYKVKWSNNGEVRTLEEVGKVAAEDEESGDNN